MEKEMIRRSISLPKTLDEKIDIMNKEYSYQSKNQLFVEMLELGIIKFYEDLGMQQAIKQLINKIDKICDDIENDR